MLDCQTLAKQKVKQVEQRAEATRKPEPGLAGVIEGVRLGKVK